MKKLTTILILACGLLASGMHQASAAPTMRLSADGGLTWVTITDNGILDANPVVGVVEYIGPIGAWFVDIDTGFGSPILGSAIQPYMDLGTTLQSSQAASLIVQLSDTNYIAFPNETFIAQSAGFAGGTVTYTAYRDSGNLLFGTTATYLGDPVGLSPSPTASSLSVQGPESGNYQESNSVVVPNGTGLFALTLETVIIHDTATHTSTDSSLIALPPPPCDCALTFNSPVSITNCAGEAIPDVVASQDCGNGPKPVTVTFVGAGTNGVCPKIITRTNSATDDCGIVHSFVQTITVNCNPDCTLASSVSNSIAGTGGLHAWVADAGPGASYYWTADNATITNGQGTTNITFVAGTILTRPATICVAIVTGAGCTNVCCIYIPLTPSCSCDVRFNSPMSITNCAGDTIPAVTASQNCGTGWLPITVKFAGAVTNGVCPKIITRTNTVVSDCGKLCKFVQTITVNCKPDCTIKTSVTTAMTGVAGYTASVADAGAGAHYLWVVTNGTLTGGQDSKQITWTAGTDTNKQVSICVTITTAPGCVSQCCAYVPLKSGPTGCTFTPGGWGAPPNGNNVATILYAMFPKLYPKGFVVGGTYTMKFSYASNITVYLPAGTTPNVLKHNFTNPTTPTDAGEFGSQVMCLKLNIDASNNGYTKAGLANLKIAPGLPLAGTKLSDLLILVNKVLGGQTSALPPGVSVSDLTGLMSGVNGNFDNCTSNNGVLVF
jgi:hypothetical protein